MSSVEYLREFVNERLSAAAEEIFGVLKEAIDEYEEEIDRQRRLLDIVWKPAIKLHRIELPKQHVCEEEEVLSDQQLCVQERNSSLDQEDPEPPQVKEEQEEPCTSQEGEQLELKQETETFVLTPSDEESDHSEDQTLNCNPDDTFNLPVVRSVVSVPKSDLHHLANISHKTESQDHKQGKTGVLRSTKNAKPKVKKIIYKRNSHTKSQSNPSMSKIHSNTHTDNTFLQCDMCEKAFQYKSHLQRHLIIHTGEKPFTCDICGKIFSLKSSLNVHLGIHTGEKPYSCKICGRDFRFGYAMRVHMRTHTGERPHSCKTCGKSFIRTSQLKAHMRTHTGEKPYSCKICGKDFRYDSGLVVHRRRAHNGQKS
ncbi:zinc finger protein 625-like [Anoplopoma fimbria]|uniref:zinc finger protein 625-like n=1 Tax=Anoplopoma fimbria TaxID=229290 RepID=UPI0023EDE0B2|nr:zinc finger protein 625-like [Anoplopoma fimbria]